MSLDLFTQAHLYHPVVHYNKNLELSVNRGGLPCSDRGPGEPELSVVDALALPNLSNDTKAQRRPTFWGSPVYSLPGTLGKVAIRVLLT